MSDNPLHSLSESIPANNQKIIDIYNKFRADQITVNEDYQRKLVWKKAHKFNFIDTILRNYPFPEIYLTPKDLDQEKLILIDEIVDGQQRLTTIRDYIEEVDVFALSKIPIKKFSDLTTVEKNSFLNYEVSVRYLKNVSAVQIKEIFQRINKTDYSLNSAERLNAQWGDSEFVCFSKQVIDKKFFSDTAVFKMNPSQRKALVDFFHGKGDNDESVFSENDMSRMLAYQYMMTIVATMDAGEYFARNEKLQWYIETYNDAFAQAEDITKRLFDVVKFIEDLKIARFTRWYNKANLFTLIVELDKADLEKIHKESFAAALTKIDHKLSLNEFGLDQSKEEAPNQQELTYLNYAREAVNQKHARIFRGEFLERLLQSCHVV
jgi:hypothetical protein